MECNVVIKAKLFDNSLSYFIQHTICGLMLAQSFIIYQRWTKDWGLTHGLDPPVGSVA